MFFNLNSFPNIWIDPALSTGTAMKTRWSSLKVENSRWKFFFCGKQRSSHRRLEFRHRIVATFFTIPAISASLCLRSHHSSVFQSHHSSSLTILQSPHSPSLSIPLESLQWNSKKSCRNSKFERAPKKYKVPTSKIPRKALARAGDSAAAVAHNHTRY